MTDSDQLIDHCLGAVRSQCIYLFTRLGLAEDLALEPCDYRQLAELHHVEPDPLYRLLRAVASLGLVEEKEEGIFALSALGQPLRKNDDNSVYAHVLHMNEEMYFAWGHALQTLKTGCSAFGCLFGDEYFDWLASHPEKEATAHFAMNDTQRSINAAVTAAYDFSKAKVVCDVGGGHGALLSAILGKYQQAKGILFDLQSGLDVARTGIGGTLPRCKFVKGDFFENVPVEADIYILKLVLHDWDNENAVKILLSCHNAMHDKARLLVIESLRPDWPETSAIDLWNMHMLVTTGGKERSNKELCQLALPVGLERINNITLNDYFSINEFRKI